ncbi:CotH kinase family protein [Nannocystaceae bacterium ST9]
MRVRSIPRGLSSSLSLALGLTTACLSGCNPDDATDDEIGDTGSDSGSGESSDASTSDTSTSGDTSTSTSDTSTSDTSSDSTSDSSSDGTDSTTGDPPDPADALFAPGTIAQFDIVLSDAEIDALNVDGKSYVPGDLTVTIDGQATELLDIGVRLKGNFGSYRTLDQKAGFLLDFNRYVDMQKLFGLGKLAVNNMVQDPSMQREVLGYRLFREGGVPAARAAHAVVTVNGELYGLYTTVESTDNEEFLDTWFGDHGGSLYEGAYGSDLLADWLSSYDQDNGPDVGLTDLAELIAALDGMTDPDTYVSDVDAHVDLDLYLTYAATSLYLGDWDGYPWSRNNYYMYRRPSDMRWVFMPWGIDQLMVDYLDPFGGGGRLTLMCAASLECRAMLAGKYEEVVARVDELGLAVEAQNLADTLYDAALADPRKEYAIDDVQATVASNIAFLTNRGPQLLGALICTDPSLVDEDNDGYNGCGQDCDDYDDAVNPGAMEVCDLDDDNCDGQWDNDPACPQCIIQPLPAPELGSAAFCFALKNWSAAEVDCVDQGGHLISIHDQAMQDFVSSTAFSIAGSDWWIGINDLSLESTFAWSDASPVDYTAWAGGEPNNAGEEDCGHIAPWAGGGWNDLFCGSEIRYICRLP